MAKSLRSKWKKKMRAVKRVRYGKKELEKLKLIVGTGSKTDVDMENISEIATVTDATAIKEKKESEDVESMEVGDRKFNKKTFRDQNGTFPVWMSQRQVKKKTKSIQQKKKKKSKSKKK
ncbi:protein LLP homolog [Ischnura elegans]|uniref:protein LLP homolog n=1 Tax=Ischnura elegans TaxID=197161 RepID=UPI001ED8A351|nr:protein LLP homolog [Ischnura elegans]